ncbi:hypothetical protein C8Q75DRAFT_730756 [Abortiporus biennis]|nr:hypothetical protein C8Q75DRAFT_730751 [Abortiporus biennis]KAI0794911.1 hypothetical protein C8Q75DRAFT_730756 [Abortiporus biennis]
MGGIVPMRDTGTMQHEENMMGDTVGVLGMKAMINGKRNFVFSLGQVLPYRNLNVKIIHRHIGIISQGGTPQSVVNVVDPISTLVQNKLTQTPFILSNRYDISPSAVLGDIQSIFKSLCHKFTLEYQLSRYATPESITAVQPLRHIVAISETNIKSHTLGDGFIDLR